MHRIYCTKLMAVSVSRTVAPLRYLPCSNSAVNPIRVALAWHYTSSGLLLPPRHPTLTRDRTGIASHWLWGSAPPVLYFVRVK